MSRLVLGYTEIVDLGVDGKTSRGQFWELLGWQVVEGPSFSCTVKCSRRPVQIYNPGQILSDSPCLGYKFLTVGAVSQNVFRQA